MDEYDDAPRYENNLVSVLSDMRKLHEISTSLISENDINQLYNDIVGAAVTLLGSDMGSMQLLIPERDELLLLASRGFAPRSASFWKRVTAHSGSVCGRALSLGTRVITPDVEQCDFINGGDIEVFRWSAIRAVQTTPLITRGGKVVGMISTHWKKVHRPSEHRLHLLDILARQAADLIERRTAEEALRESEERLRSAVVAAELGTFIWDLENDEVKPDDRMLYLFGVSKSASDMAAALRSTLHPDDLDRYLNAIDETSKAETPKFIQEDIRIQLPNGSQRWLAFHAQVHTSAKTGKAARMAGCVIDITGRKTLEQQKNEFIEMVSHELKTPATGIKAYGQLLQDRFLHNDPETNLRLIAKQNKLTNRLINLLNRLLDSTRVVDGSLKPHLEKADINVLIREYVDDLQSLTQNHQLNFRAAEKQIVLVDKEQIGQVLTNLISNAIKYSPEGGDINITSETTNDGQCMVSIADTGIGIDDSEKKKIFERFFRKNNDSTRSSTGVGLGLYICDAIIRQHGGEIGVKSQAGKGSVFYFLLPHHEAAIVNMAKPSDNDSESPPEQRLA